MSKETHTGKIKFYTPAKGFGFIKMKIPGGDTEEVYFSTNGMLNPFARPLRGDRVQFKIRSHKNGLRAFDIKEIEK